MKIKLIDVAVGYFTILSAVSLIAGSVTLLSENNLGFIGIGIGCVSAAISFLIGEKS